MNAPDNDILRRLADSAPVGLWVTDPSGTAIFLNETWRAWTGANEGDAVPWGWLDQVEAGDRAELLEAFRKAMPAGRGLKVEFRLPGPEGTIRWCYLEGAPCNDQKGSYTGYMGSVADITGLKNAREKTERVVVERTQALRQKNEALKQSERKYHRMIDEVQDYAIIMMDREGTILNWNHGAGKIKGYTEEEIIGRNFRIFYLPEDLESYLPEKLISQAEETGRAVHEGWRMRKDGTTFWGSVVITALHDDNNNVIGFSKMTRDLTEQKMVADTARRYMQELERKNAELEQFAYVSSHDLQEPLRKIRTFSDMLSEMVQDPKQRDYLQKINASAERMSALISDLLDYSRLNKEEGEISPVDLNEVLAQVRSDLELLIRQKDALIVHDKLPLIKGISLQFYQLFLNLLSNSLKFTTRRPVIRITSGPAPLYELVAVGLDLNWSYVRLVFSDNGIGFDPRYAGQIFTIFQRLNTRQQFSGTGIGLAICKKIVGNHQGHIMAQSVPGEGADFIIYLPLR
jgi:PAS domain S-box-containing protein